MYVQYYIRGMCPCPIRFPKTQKSPWRLGMKPELINIGLEHFIFPYVTLCQGGRGHWSVNSTGTHSFMFTLSFSLAQKLWTLVIIFGSSLNYFWF